MKRTKIAPTLIEWADAMPACDESDRAWRELRALLAVAREARSQVAAIAGTDDLERVCATDTGRGLLRALRRLDRVSGGGTGRGHA